MLSIAILVLCFQAAQEPGVEVLIGRLSQDDPAVRDDASREIVRRWKDWKGTDLEKLEKLAGESDREAAARASDALQAIRFRRQFGENWHPKIEEADLLFEAMRSGGRSLQAIGWMWPGGPIFNMSPDLKKLIGLGPEIEPFVRLRLSDPVLRNEAAVALSHLGGTESLSALIELLPGKDGPLSPAEDFTITCLLHALYELTGTAIGMTSRGRSPYNPEIRVQWRKWYDEKKDYLHTPQGQPAPDPQIHYGPRVVLDTEAWIASTSTKDYRRDHPVIQFEEIKNWLETPEYEKHLREFCTQLILARVWKSGSWDTNAILALGGLSDPRSLAALRKISLDPGSDDLTLNRTAWALAANGSDAIPDIEKILSKWTGPLECYVTYPLARAKVEAELGRGRLSSRVDSDGYLLLFQCMEAKKATPELLELLRRDPPSEGILEIAGFLKSEEAHLALETAIENSKVGEVVRCVAAQSLARLGDSRGLDFLRGRLDSEEPPVRLAAAEGLWRVGNREGEKTLLGLLELRPLEDGRERSTVPAAVLPVRTSSLHLVRRACELLGEMGDPAALQPLRKLESENLNGFLGRGRGAVRTGWPGRPDIVARAKLGDLSGVRILEESLEKGDPLGAEGSYGMSGALVEIGLKKYARRLVPLLWAEDPNRELYAARSILLLLEKGK